jgi:hypothetical protein
MKTLLSTVVLVLVGFGAANAQTVPQSWNGTYEGMESGMNATGTRSFSSWAKIELQCGEGFCDWLYTDGENSDTYSKFFTTAKGTANAISFYYSRCMPLEYGSSEPCTDSYKKGDLMFKLVKGKAVKGKSTITTVWGKLKKETSGNVFFVKAKA